MKRAVFSFLMGFSILLGGCSQEPNQSNESKNVEIESDNLANEETPNNLNEKIEETPKAEEWNWIESDGKNIVERIKEPDGFHRTKIDNESLADFIRNYPLREDGSRVMLFDGREKHNQSGHVAVFDMYLGERDLQQCADSIMRMYAEYYYNAKEYDKIKFHFVNGFLCEYEKWEKGYRVSVEGNDVKWVKKADENDSPEIFEKYLNTLFSYASTLSLEKEAEEIELVDLKIGDIFIKGGSPGHVVLVVDVCINENGDKAFLLGQGYMPAQSFHIIKNPLHEENPWYFLSEFQWPFVTQEYTFPENSLKRIN